MLTESRDRSGSGLYPPTPHASFASSVAGAPPNNSMVSHHHEGEGGSSCHASSAINNTMPFGIHGCALLPSVVDTEGGGATQGWWGPSHSGTRQNSTTLSFVADTPNNSMASGYHPVLPHPSCRVGSSLTSHPAAPANSTVASAACSAGNSPLVVPNNSLAVLGASHSAHGQGLRIVAGTARGTTVVATSGSCDEMPVPNNSLALPHAAIPTLAACATEQTRRELLYECFARPPSRSVDTAAVERCFASFITTECGVPPATSHGNVVHWHRIVAALGPAERSAYGSMFPHGAQLDIERFMGFVEHVARSRR